MMVVLVMAGVMLKLAIPKIDTARYRADAVAQLVRVALQTAQRGALTRQYDVVVSIDTTKRRIRVFWDADNDGSVSGGERCIWTSLQTGNRFAKPSTGLSGSVSASVVGANLKDIDGYPSFTFHRDGSVSTDVEIYISTAAQKTGTTLRAIRLIQATGKTDWFRQSTAGAWSLARL